VPFFFLIEQFRKLGEKLVWFCKEEGAFKVATGGDKAPFGK